MVFNPEESIDFHGFTGPFIQYTHARLKSILRKEQAASGELGATRLLPSEKGIILLIETFPAMIEQAAIEHDPSTLALYVYELAKLFSSFLNEVSVLNAESDEKKQLRLQLCEMTANVIKSSMALLGMKVTERM